MKNTLAGLLLLICAGAARAQPGHNGFNMACWWKDCYGQASTQASLRKLAETGAGWVAVIPTWHMRTDTDSTIFADDRTPDDAGLRAAIRTAKGLGLSVAIKPHVDADGGRVRALIHPTDVKEWFKSYRAMMTHYARLAAEEHANMLVVGTELFRLTGLTHRREWEAVIAEARAVYPGPMTYAANWYDFEHVSFWDKLDFIGIDGYFPVAGESKTAMKIGWHIYKPLIAAEAAAAGKPVIFTEFGISCQKGANKKPWEWKDFGPLDLEVQKNYFQSFLEVFGSERWFAGLWQWGWEINPDAGGPSDKSMTVQGKPALDVLKAYFGAHPRPATGLSAAQKNALNASVGTALSTPVPGFHSF